MIETIALDAGSKRTYDENGFLHVSISPLTRVQVAPYHGSEIPGWKELGLDPERIYKGYRSAEELAKPETVESINGIPIQLQHHMDYADAPAKMTRVGSTGTDGAFRAPFLTNSLHIQDKNAIDRINDGSMRELSLAYRYKPVFTAGTSPAGEKYDFLMTDISANHLALVDEGRAGHEVLVYDSKQGDQNMIDDKKKDVLQAKDDDAIEKQEVAIANKVKDGAQALIDLHKQPAEQEPHPETADGDKDEQIAALIEELTAAGLDPSKVEGLEGKLKDLAYQPAEDEDPDDAEQASEDADDEDKGAEPEAPEDAEDEDDAEGDPEAEDEDDEDTSAEDEDDEDGDKEDSFVADAKKACGMDGEDPEVQKAFVEGLKYGKNGGPKEKPQLSEDHALRIVSRVARTVERRLNSKFAAIDETRRSLGKVRSGAFDSAGDVYRAALRQEGINPKGLSAAEARVAYRAYMAASSKRARGVAMDSKPKNKPTFIGSILNSISKE
ncbi:MAG: DUF2213 domain-containing protein [Succinivibrio sp.]|nr:DUF2213 domain-containing protein [Succinivibrio sp.]